MAEMRGADLIAEYLVKEKVPYVFGLCGHGIVGLMDGLHNYRDQVKMMTVHHEQVAGYIADAYFRVSGQPVATFTSCGPGSTNLVIALACAMMDSSAFLAITGNVPTSQFNRAPFQETYRYHQADFPSVIRPYVKRSFQVARPGMLPLALRQSFKTMAAGRPGPVNLDVPLDVFVEAVDVVEDLDPALWRHGIEPRSGASPEAAARALDLLASARNPVILVGDGAVLADAATELRTLVEALQIPVAQTPTGAGTLPADHPLALGSVGRNGTDPANRATRDADVLLALGVRFDDRVSSGWVHGTTFAIPPTKLIQVDVDSDELGRNYPVHLGITADVRTFLRQLLTRPGPAEATAVAAPWRQRVATWKVDWEAFNERSTPADQSPIHPLHLLRTLRKVLPRNGILTVDVGAHHNWTFQQWPVYEPRTLLQSWGFAAMGFGVAGVLGAKLAAPDRPAVALCGDGGLLMTSHIVATAVEYDIPVTWVVWNNSGYVSIRDIQTGAFGRDTTTMFTREKTGEPFSPDYAALARAYGAEGIRVTKPGDLGDAIEMGLASDRPTLIDVVVDTVSKPAVTGSWHLPPLAPLTPNYADVFTRTMGRPPAP